MEKSKTVKKTSKKETTLAVVTEKEMNAPVASKEDMKQLKLFSGNIKKELTAIEGSFVKIGYYLHQIRENKLYELLGCKNIYDFANREFGIARGTCSDFINIVDRFCIRDESGNPTPKIAEDYKKFKSSQLIPLLGVKDEKVLEEITPDMTVREIKQKVKADSQESNESENSSNVRTNDENVIDVESREIKRKMVWEFRSLEDYNEKLDAFDDFMHKIFSVQKGEYMIEVFRTEI